MQMNISVGYVWTYFSLVKVSEIFLLLKFGDMIGSSWVSHVTWSHFTSLQPHRKQTSLWNTTSKLSPINFYTSTTPYISITTPTAIQHSCSRGGSPQLRKSLCENFQNFSKVVRGTGEKTFFLAVFLALISDNLHVTSATQESHKLFDVSNQYILGKLIKIWGQYQMYKLHKL